ncbi:metallophosphoesterase, calcineurin superfamily [Alkaliphilus metalliredigens QYMF]|uniref:Metallophosphoesterase, calcineurin superfamily n=1 Tax=Alkaliphilus metalliredigens (strain QYMF) TaxID=293826 RepID=A6TWZ4_ALKMQ|nr:metallophosphoesterase family protein [Alkaliphilus metalliredigens]ABR50712.1 metallophosphoesterase, calcineurin superfamily [Alkaliphilus metalliredigens QYMF]
MKNIIKKWMYLLLDKPLIPEELMEAKGPLLLHISDTPMEVYSFIYKLVNLINPQYIVHTGDIVDNIKLENFKNRLADYQTNLEKFVDKIEKIHRGEIYYVIGNHDKMKSVQGVTKKGTILYEGKINIEGKTFYLRHNYRRVETKADYYLYGHRFEPKHKKIRSQQLLNGILNINVIDLSTGLIYQIDYPMATNQFRKMERGRIGF